MKRRFRVFFLTVLVLGIAACDPSPLDLPILSGTGSEKDKPRIVVECTKTLPSGDLVTLTWEFHPRLDDSHRIDLTVYKDGFDQDRYASLWPLKRGQKPREPRSSKLRKHPVDPALSPRLAGLSSDPRQGSTSVRLKGLASGLVYELRLLTLQGRGWLPGPTVRIEAPVCITEQPGETNEHGPAGSER